MGRQYFHGAPKFAIEILRAEPQQDYPVRLEVQTHRQLTESFVLGEQEAILAPSASEYVGIACTGHVFRDICHVVARTSEIDNYIPVTAFVGKYPHGYAVSPAMMTSSSATTSAAYACAA